MDARDLTFVKGGREDVLVGGKPSAAYIRRSGLRSVRQCRPMGEAMAT